MLKTTIFFLLVLEFLLLVLSLMWLLVLLLQVLLLLVLLQLLLEGACAITLLPTNRTGIRGVTHPREVLSFFLSRAETHSFCHAEASASKTFIAGCSMK
jgi:hypothetical protein